MERGGSADGLISLREYPEGTRKIVLTSVDAGNWDKLYFPLPKIGRVDAYLRIRLQTGDKQIAERFFRYTEQLGWINAQGGKPTFGMWISLLSHPEFDRKTAAWDASYQLTLWPYTVKAEAREPLEGDAGCLWRTANSRAPFSDAWAAAPR